MMPSTDVKRQELIRKYAISSSLWWISGQLPDSSESAYHFAVSASLSNLISWCDVQLTKDGAEICFPDVRLDKASNIDRFFPNMSRTYNVDGDSKQGWFSVDYTLHDLENVSMKQAIDSRTDGFDKNLLPILEVQKVANISKLSSFLIMVEYSDCFSHMGHKEPWRLSF